jgi:hypothetical protein
LEKHGIEFFEVPVSGSLITNDFYGTIDIPEFFAKIEGEIPTNLFVENVQPKIQECSINSQFYQSLAYPTNLYPITRTV